MAEWRIGRGWSDDELEEYLAKLHHAEHNFPFEGPKSQQYAKDWRRYYTEAIIGKEVPGKPVPNGAFEIGWRAISEYQFSDPGIVVGHFNPKDPIEGRTMALEIKCLGLHYLCGVRIGAVRQYDNEEETVSGFRYDTLEGHLEAGSEWFIITKKHKTGDVFFRISASWRPDNFPNWWSRVGFEVLGQTFQLAWHRLAYLRLREIVGSNGTKLVPVPYGKRLVHTGPEIVNSDLWILNQPSATARVQKLGRENAPETREQNEAHT